MFKLFFIYPVVLFIVVWLASDVEIGASVYAFDDNHISIEFPKKKFRSEENPDPWYSFYWNAESARDDLQKINDAVVK
ncbi:MAG: hypothetical protein GY951_17770 [Psychromonas sp.]|nr:hypothetical protein [Alteromonadales bacterium]MCP5079887.1 hypothetical protein [Psychromonas sp.]